jgi:hypothetical protein
MLSKWQNGATAIIVGHNHLFQLFFQRAVFNSGIIPKPQWDGTPFHPWIGKFLCRERSAEWG